MLIISFDFYIMKSGCMDHGGAGMMNTSSEIICVFHLFELNSYFAVFAVFIPVIYLSMIFWGNNSS